MSKSELLQMAQIASVPFSFTLLFVGFAFILKSARDRDMYSATAILGVIFVSIALTIMQVY